MYSKLARTWYTVGAQRKPPRGGNLRGPEEKQRDYLSHHAAYTTAPAPVVLPDLPLSVYRSFVAEFQQLAPDQAARDRIRRSLDVLLGAAIYPTATVGIYRVQSCQDAATHYEATSWTCSCADYTRRLEPCKHAWALTILSAVLDQQRWNTVRYAPTAKALAALDRGPRPAA